jgi:ubiquinone/menaquinone biosynthesis C-methylase UbiE
VGFGAGTDFIQWIRAGAIASGIDLTTEALCNVRQRLSIYGFSKTDPVQVGDAENLPFEANEFDLGYSFGVLHHTPNTEKAIAELVRVVRPGGEIKMMLYNRRSIWACNLWVKKALMRGRPWKSIGWVLWNHNESVGTKGYTRKELKSMLLKLPLHSIEIRTEITAADYLSASAFPPLNWFYKICLRAAGYHQGWHPRHYASRVNATDQGSHAITAQRDPSHVLLTGNRLGFFHCIYARKSE